MIRKAELTDLDGMACLVTDSLGTCYVTPSIHEVKDSDIFVRNRAGIENDLAHYFVYEENDRIVGLCGIKDNADYAEVLYMVVDKGYRNKGIATALLQACCGQSVKDIVYEAWGDGEYVNSLKVLQKCGFVLLKNLGDDYYSRNGYCPFCINRSKEECKSCKAEIWIRKV